MRNLFAFFFLFLLLPVGFADNSQWADSDSAIFGPKYQEILKLVDSLHAEHGDRTRVIDYGQTAEGRTLRMLLVYNPAVRSRTRQTLYITGSIHGNEYLNIEDRLPRAILEKSYQPGVIKEFVDEGGAFVFVPIVNPDGYDRRQRENTHGVDLNRDWDVVPANFKGFKEVETRSLSQKLLSLKDELGLQYRVTVDYHCCAGALLHPWSYLEENVMDPKDLASHKSIGSLAKTNLGSAVEVGTTGEILGYLPLGTTKDYFYDTYRALSFTYEGRYAEENKYLDGHLAWWEQITQFVLAEKHSPPFGDPLSRLRLGLGQK